MHKLRSCLYCIIAVMLLNAVVTAAEDNIVNLTIAPVNSIYTIAGRLQGAAAAKVVSILVYNENNEIAHASFAYTDEKGAFSYSFRFETKLPSGTYFAKVGTYGGNVSDEVVFEYLNNTDKETFFTKDLPIAAGSEKAMISLLEEYREKLGLNLLSNHCLSNGGYQKIASRMAAYGTFSGVEYFFDSYMKEYAVQLLAETQQKDIPGLVAQYSDIYLLDQQTCTDLYKSFKDKSEDILKMFYGQSINSLQEIRTLFNENTFLYALNNAYSYGEIPILFSNYASVIPFSLSNYNACNKTELARYLIEDNYENMNELKEAINSFYNLPTPNNSGSGSNRNGNGSVTNFSVDTQTMAEIKNQDSFPYVDMQDVEWAVEAISYLTDKGVVKGDGKNHFEPNRTITREEFVQMLVNALGIINSSAESSFADVPREHWAYAAVSSAKALGLVNGIDNQCFGANQPVTRQDMAVLCARSLAIMDKTFDKTNKYVSFIDEDKIANYALNSVICMKEYNIINGFEDGSFRPTEAATRAQAAVMISTVMKGVEK